MEKWQRSLYQPNLPLGADGTKVTASKAHITLSKEAAKEGMVLLKNNESLLPFQAGTKLALFGKGSFDYVKGGGGSGDVTVAYTTNLYEGFKKLPEKVEVYEALSDYYRKEVEKQYEAGAEPGMTVEPAFPEETAKKARAYTDTAVICISRFSGEGWDRKSSYDKEMDESVQTDPLLEKAERIFPDGDFYLTKEESAMVEQVQQVLQSEYIVTDREHRELAAQILDEDRVLLVEDLADTEVNDILLTGRREKSIDTAPLYANFTSGSTGQPKGVVVSHRSVLDFIDIFTELFGITSEDRIGNQAPFDFDVSVKDIYSSLKMGATLVIVPKQLFSQPAPLLDYLCDNKVTVMIWAVSALCLISIFHGLDYRTPESVRKVLFSGEVMPPKHLKAWMEHLPEVMPVSHLNIWREHLPDALFVNLYGPTEITCNCTYHRIDRNRDYSEGVPVGCAFPNEHVFLLDDNNQEVTKSGIAGEICVRGTALALGYYRMPEQTAER